MSELERLKRIEVAAQELVEAKYFHKMGPLWEKLKVELKVEVDYKNLPFGTDITDSEGIKGKYLGRMDGDRCMVLPFDIKCGIEYWRAQYCTVEPPSKYTELVKHELPKFSKRPEWVTDKDIILHPHGESTGAKFNWGNGAKWFAVIRDSE